MKPALTLSLALATAAAAQEETDISVTGSSRSGSEILQSLAGRLDHVRGNPVSASRANDAAFLVERYLIEAGYNDAEVAPEILGDRELRLNVDEGARDALGEVTVNGVDDNELNETLQDLFRLEPQKRAEGFDAPPVTGGDVRTGLRLMRSQLRSLGHYDATVTLAERREDPETLQVDFTINVDPGPVFTIAAPRFTGEETGGLRELTAPYVGRPATTDNLNAMRSEVVERYQSRGFVNAEVNTSLDTENRRVRPVYQLVKGERVTIREFRVTGYEKTNPERVEARVDDLVGQPLDGTLANERIGQIIATGAFSSIQTELTPVGDGLVDATLRLREAEARGVSLSLGFDTYEGGIVGASYYDRNFRGNVRNFTAGFEASQRSLLGEVSLTDPWLFGSDARGQIKLFARTRANEGYANARSGLEGSIEYEFDEHHTLSLRAGWAYNSTESDGLLRSELGETQYGNPFLILNQTFDYRDSALLPTTGWHVETPLEFGAAIADETTTYVKVGLEGSYHRPLGDSGQIHAGLRGGLLIPGGGSRNLPIDLRYFTGGARSVRSFREHELGPWSVTGYPVGGEAYWVANLEYTHPIAGPLRAVAFLDAGGLSRQWEDLATSDPELAAGLGLRINLPIGPARLEYGHNLTRDGRDPSGTFHFAIGATF